MAKKKNRRETKVALPKDLLKVLRRETKEYGTLRDVCELTGIRYPNFHLIVKSGKATPTNIVKVEQALKQIAA